jgi:hypothetical protein
MTVAAAPVRSSAKNLFVFILERPVHMGDDVPPSRCGVADVIEMGRRCDKSLEDLQTMPELHTAHRAQ